MIHQTVIWMSPNPITRVLLRETQRRRRIRMWRQRFEYRIHKLGSFGATSWRWQGTGCSLEPLDGMSYY
jgi:hypothetical protein